MEKKFICLFCLLSLNLCFRLPWVGQNQMRKLFKKVDFFFAFFLFCLKSCLAQKCICPRLSAFYFHVYLFKAEEKKETTFSFVSFKHFSLRNKKINYRKPRTKNQLFRTRLYNFFLFVFCLLYEVIQSHLKQTVCLPLPPFKT